MTDKAPVSPEMENELKDDIVYNRSKYPEIFGLTEAEYFACLQGYWEYRATDANETSQGYRDWMQMYKGIHRESTSEIEKRTWLACCRWINQRAASLTSQQGAATVDELHWQIRQRDGRIDELREIIESLFEDITLGDWEGMSKRKKRYAEYIQSLKVSEPDQHEHQATFNLYHTIKEKIGELGYNNFIHSKEVEEYREWLRNDKYKHRIDWFEKKFPNGLYYKDEDGSEIGIRIMTKQFLAEADAAYTPQPPTP